VLARARLARQRPRAGERIERAVALSRGEWIEAEALPPSVRQQAEERPGTRLPQGNIDLDNLVADFERGLLLGALKRSGGVKKRAAQSLGITFRSATGSRSSSRRPGLRVAAAPRARLHARGSLLAEVVVISGS
jgi:transcriptional regulator with GAF, ATPase, and Fis domain